MNAAFVELLRCPLTGSRLRLDAFERDGDRIEYGTLAGQGGEFPVIAGIPIFTGSGPEALSLLRQRKLPLAVAAAAFGGGHVRVLDTVLRSHPFTNRLRRFTKPLEQNRKTAWLERAAERLVPRNGGQLVARDLYDFAYLRIGTPSHEAYHYNYCRFGMPGYFVGLSMLNAAGAREGFVLDHSCGSGHLTWALRRSCGPASVVGCDVSFLSLYIARQTMERDAFYVCADVTQLPFRDGVFSMVFNSDAFNNFSAKLTAFQEMVRTAASSAAVVLVWLRNSAHPHLYGKPVSADAYKMVVGAHRRRIYSDAWILKRFLGQANGVPAPDEAAASEEATFSMWISKGQDVLPDAEAFGAAPIPFERLSVNPIYTEGTPGSFERRYPSTFYASEDVDKKYYYPERFTLTPEQKRALGTQQVDGVADLLRSGALVGRPAHFA